MQKRYSLPALTLALGLNLAPFAQAATPGTLPTVTTTAPADNTISSEFDAVGPYGQPEWTEHRRFSTTRIYLQQEPWHLGFEQWWRARSYDDNQTKHRFSEELELGLPYRFQFDFYYNWAHDGDGTHTDEYAFEVRWALADWGKIWGNPTLYLEYALVPSEYGGDVLESKILLGDDIGKKWQWGLNFVFESELSHELAKEFVVAGGLSYAISEVVSAGLEFQWKHETVAGERSNPEVQFEIGPSVQFRIGKRAHLDLVALFGTTNEGPSVESFIIFGYDFGNIAGGSSHYHPVSNMNN